MGVKSTVTIERDDVIKFIKDNIDSASNEELGYMLECFKEESRYKNYNVVDYIAPEPIKAVIKLKPEGEFKNSIKNLTYCNRRCQVE